MQVGAFLASAQWGLRESGGFQFPHFPAPDNCVLLKRTFVTLTPAAHPSLDLITVAQSTFLGQNSRLARGGVCSRQDGRIGRYLQRLNRKSVKQ